MKKKIEILCAALVGLCLLIVGTSVCLALDTFKADVNFTFIHRVFGSHMVLQQQPAQATIWGYSKGGAGVRVKLSMQGYQRITGAYANATELNTVSTAGGLWKIKLPKTKGSLDWRYKMRVSSSYGESQLLEDVVFGEVYYCGGQSNMQLTLVEDSTMEKVTKDFDKLQDYERWRDQIRVFSLGAPIFGPHGSSLEKQDYRYAVEKPWGLSTVDYLIRGGRMATGFGFTHKTSHFFLKDIFNKWLAWWRYTFRFISGYGDGAYSSACYHAGKAMAETEAKHDNSRTPIGLISGAVGGSANAQWLPEEIVDRCTGTGAYGPGAYDYPTTRQYDFLRLYDDNMKPLMVGPLALQGALWYQGESDVGNAHYPCLLANTVALFRAGFQLPDYGYKPPAWHNLIPDGRVGNLPEGVELGHWSEYIGRADDDPALGRAIAAVRYARQLIPARLDTFVNFQKRTFEQQPSRVEETYEETMLNEQGAYSGGLFVIVGISGYCGFPSMPNDVPLPKKCPYTGGAGPPANLRNEQLAAARAIPYASFVPAYDFSRGCNLHPMLKQPVGWRMARAVDTIYQKYNGGDSDDPLAITPAVNEVVAVTQSCAQNPPCVSVTFSLQAIRFGASAESAKKVELTTPLRKVVFDGTTSWQRTSWRFERKEYNPAAPANPWNNPNKCTFSEPDAQYGGAVVQLGLFSAEGDLKRTVVVEAETSAEMVGADVDPLASSNLQTVQESADSSKEERPVLNYQFSLHGVFGQNYEFEDCRFKESEETSDRVRILRVHYGWHNVPELPFYLDNVGANDVFDEFEEFSAVDGRYLPKASLLMPFAKDFEWNIAGADGGKKVCA